jgi:hypothetical protein
VVTGGAEMSVVLREGRVRCARLWVHWHWVQASRIKWQVVVSYLAGEGELTVGLGIVNVCLLSSKDPLKGM